MGESKDKLDHMDTHLNPCGLTGTYDDEVKPCLSLTTSSLDDGGVLLRERLGPCTVALGEHLAQTQ